jgi:hypothetical protein
MTRTTDDVHAEPVAPLGAPIRPIPTEPEGRWVPVDPAKPNMQRNTKTGLWRNVRPPPT